MKKIIIILSVSVLFLSSLTALDAAQYEPSLYPDLFFPKNKAFFHL
ncbi:MAG: hypothetical protein JXB88_22355 [Spirochaetales bacterium]|nr:hypothetical protein [Spirochaetales bacterium]